MTRLQGARRSLFPRGSAAVQENRWSQLAWHSARIENYRRRISLESRYREGEGERERGDRRDIKQAHLYVNKLRSTRALYNGNGNARVDDGEIIGGN